MVLIYKLYTLYTLKTVTLFYLNSTLINYFVCVTCFINLFPQEDNIGNLWFGQCRQNNYREGLSWR